MVLAVLVCYILFKLEINKRKEAKRKQIRTAWRNILAELLMDESVMDRTFELPPSFVAELKKPFVRNVLASELVRTRLSLRGQMAETVISVYNQLGLQKHSKNLLQSSLWHKQAKGIQQLSSMAQHQYFDAIYKRVNHPNTWVRNEAQMGMIRMRGIQGLGFLKHLRRPISEWQQFNLLNQLQLEHSKEIPEMSEWLLSNNPSVVQFSIHLCEMYQLFQYTEQINNLRQHPHPVIRTCARACLIHWGIIELNTPETFYQNLIETYTTVQTA